MKILKFTNSEMLGHLQCITYMGVSGPSLLIESTDISRNAVPFNWGSLRLAPVI